MVIEEELTYHGSFKEMHMLSHFFKYFNKITLSWFNDAQTAMKVLILTKSIHLLHNAFIVYL